MEEQNQKNWFGRNWMWVVPLGGCLTLIVLFIVLIGGAIFGVSKVLTESTPYQYAIEEAQNSPELIAIIGEPIETDGIMSGSLNFENDEGHVDITIPLAGPAGKASVSVKGDKYDGVWTYESLYITIKSTKEQINLLEKDLEGM